MPRRCVGAQPGGFPYGRHCFDALALFGAGHSWQEKWTELGGHGSHGGHVAVWSSGSGTGHGARAHLASILGAARGRFGGPAVVMARSAGAAGVAAGGEGSDARSMNLSF